MYTKTQPPYFAAIVRRNNFTLLEVLISLLLMTFIISAFTIGAARLIKHERFSASADLLRQKLELAEELSLITDNDIKVLVEKKGKVWTAHLEPDQKLPFDASRKINRSPSLDGIDTIEFEGQSPPFEWKFSSLKHEIPRGIITLTSYPFQETITLQGFLGPIEFGGELQPNENSANHYPEQVRALYEAEKHQKKKPTAP